MIDGTKDPVAARSKSFANVVGKIKGGFDHAQDQLRDMVEDIRRISRNLSPALLENLGLKETLKHLLAEFGKYQEVTMNIDIEDIQNVFSSQTEINLFRILQEYLINIAKNAQATIVSVTIKSQDAGVNF